MSTSESRPGMRTILAPDPHPPISCDWGAVPRAQPSYSKPILTSTRYSTISPSATIAVDFTTSTVWMLRTVRDAVATAWRAASLHDRGLVPTISLMMMTPTDPPPAANGIHRPSVHDDTRPARFRTGLVAAQGIRRGG